MMRQRRGQEGFTLIELTVSLLAGLIVALGIVGLSRDATHTFHEEMRSSVAEANLRTAIDRLRADLARAGYMSTGNVITDALIARAPGVLNPINPALVGLARLSSVLLNAGGSTALTPLSTTNGLRPDVIDIAGNMTSTDQYEVTAIQQAGGGCQQIFLNPQSPSMFRLLGAGTPADQAKELNNVFQPSAPGLGQFGVRFVDLTGRTQFLATCPGAPTGVQGGGQQPFVLVSPLSPVLPPTALGGVGGASGFGTGSLVNPVQIVRWQIVPATSEEAQYQASPLGGQPLTATPDATKYDLVRSYVDVTTGVPIPGTQEVVAEYAVDLEFAFSVDGGPNNLQPNIQTFAFDDPVNGTWAPNLVTNPPAPQVGPQRIRSIRVRLVTRSSEADRTLNVLVPNPTGPFMYRYCVLAACDPMNPAGILQFARARTLTGEVSLPNQARSY